MNPVTRREVFLDALCDGETCNLEPATREEILLKKLSEAGGGGSGGGVFVVHGTVISWAGSDENYKNDVVICDDSYEEAEKAMQNGLTVIFRIKTYYEYDDGSKKLMGIKQYADSNYSPEIFHDEDDIVPSRIGFEYDSYWFNAEELNMEGNS